MRSPYFILQLGGVLVELNYDMLELRNGIRVAHRYVDCPDVVVRIRVQDGSYHEPADKKGILHLVEHLSFRPSTNPDFEGELFRISGRQGSDALTDMEGISISERVPSSSFGEILKLLYILADNCSFTSPDFEIEKKVVVNEISANFKRGTISYYVNNLFRNNIFPSHPYGILPAGELDIVKKLSKETVEEYKCERINASNVMLTVVGGYQKLVENLESTFGGLRPGIRREQNITDLPLIEPVRAEKRFKGMPHTMMMILFQAPGMKDKDMIPMQILKEYLGGGTSSILFSRVRQNGGLAYHIGVSNLACNLNRSVWAFSAERFQKKNAKTIEAIIHQEVEKVKQEEFDMKLLEMIRRSFLMNFYEVTLEGISEQACRIDFQESVPLPLSISDELKLWEELTPEDLAKTAQKYFNDRYATLIVHP